MKRQNIAGCYKNAVGTVFLLAGAFFVCSTLLSMRTVLADPIAPVDTGTGFGPQSVRAGTNVRASRISPRQTQANNTNVARTTASRGVTSRANTNVATVSRATGASRNVVSRTNGVNSSNRTVRSRTAVAPSQTNARVSLSGSAIRGSKAATSSNYTYISNKLYTGNYSNIIDSTTGLISAEAYQNCMDSYYTCMDEICTARSAAQGRCACAARVKSFIQAEQALETANEELIKASGELALLIANKGKDVSAAFQLTDAEKVMNCVSWQEVVTQYGESSEEAKKWCTGHNIYASNGGTVSSCSKPDYCSDNNFGFDIKNIEGSSSDILASLQAWADSKESTTKLLTQNNNNLLDAFTNVSDIVSGLTSTNNSDTAVSLDSLANTWGYELFQYAHNNVCGRVLDSCFNGIYEGCGTPPTVNVNNSTGGTTKATLCANNATSNCPFNYNSKIAISATGDVTLNERGSSSATTTSSASCFGYTTSTSTSGATSTSDPYATLRGPVADARRSVMQKYLLDANAACDVYGDTLRRTAQNIGYQKVAAQQALQQKRLEFVREEESAIATNYRNAISNFNECLSELYDCYTTQERSNSTWSKSRIKTYCAQVANVPHCYEEMVCSAPNNKLEAVITRDAGISTACNNSEKFEENTCRNVLTLSEILDVNGKSALNDSDDTSRKLREQCLQSIGIDGVREWEPELSSGRTNWSAD